MLVSIHCPVGVLGFGNVHETSNILQRKKFMSHLLMQNDCGQLSAPLILPPKTVRIVTVAQQSSLHKFTLLTLKIYCRLQLCLCNPEKFLPPPKFAVDTSKISSLRFPNVATPTGPANFVTIGRFAARPLFCAAQ